MLAQEMGKSGKSFLLKMNKNNDKVHVMTTKMDKWIEDIELFCEFPASTTTSAASLLSTSATLGTVAGLHACAVG